MTQVITHRGLDPDKNNYFPESSLEAFCDQFRRGFGLEFDVLFTSDFEAAISHDKSLHTLSRGADSRLIANLPAQEIFSTAYGGCHMPSLENLLDLMPMAKPGQILALHLKYFCQDQKSLGIILKKIQPYDTASLVIFDVLPKAAEYLLSRNPDLLLAPSVAHRFDIQRYNHAVGGTLLSVEEAILNEPLYKWVWLDEWDLVDENGREKTLYNREVFSKFRDSGQKIALVTPELHASSPGLLGGEAHGQGNNMAVWEKRVREILEFKPDAVCTDHPDVIKNYVQ